MPVSSSHNHPPSCVACGILAPCLRALTRLFRIPASGAVSIRAFRFRNLRKAAARMSPRRRRRRTFRSVRAVFWPLIVPPSSTPAASTAEGEAAVRGEVPETAVHETSVHEKPVHAPVSSPETPAYVKVVARLRSGRSAGSGDGEEGDEKKEEACRSFESCLMEMLVEEGKARELQDVEELLRCWERLKSPVFVELVCRFYGELCNDLFPAPRVDKADMDGGDGEGSVSTSGI
ncbi:hypothetical protein BAE44_0013798 [Dichanthelium oligosanthes]|uniref:OVATE domain-containing protein n=1 Tax=Dichanthelium oligosanthes TaxID=888268 RepID=A0A1E5VJ62_9POAL|nr:hypothetical protein BAE44_0013798 [Dichanthelium oligosanthes]